MTKGIFVTATGTDIGKTYVSALILKKLLATGINAGYYKPVLSGAELHNGKIIPGDAEYVLKTAGLDTEPQKCVSYMFRLAVSPHLASQIENNPVKLDKILEDYKLMQSQYDYLIVEGAGGIACPFSLSGDNKIMLADVIKVLELDIIIVASAELGTINSTILTVEYARAHGLNIRGIILNNYDENDFMHRDNLKQIEYLVQVPVIAVVGYGELEIGEINL